VGQSGDDDLIEVADDRVERLRLIRWLRRQLSFDVAGFGPRHHRPCRHVGAVVGDPVDDLVPGRAEFFGCHSGDSTANVFSAKLALGRTIVFIHGLPDYTD